MQRILHQRALDVKLDPELQRRCMTDLGKWCSEKAESGLVLEETTCCLSHTILITCILNHIIHLFIVACNCWRDNLSLECFVLVNYNMWSTMLGLDQGHSNNCTTKVYVFCIEV